MCGIAGALNFKLSYAAINKSMLHRGPDEQYGFIIDNVDLYHLRLSIIDIKNGKQPMHLDDRFTIIFNGEVYNYNELKITHQLPATTSSDTEVLLLLYRKYGADLLQYIDGMFAFAIYDKQEKKIFIARDRAGKKPLYYYADGEKIVFASELNCIKSLLPLQMEHDNFYHYLRLGSFYSSLTPYKNVAELKAGTFLLIDCTTLDIQENCWWNINDHFKKSNNDSFEESTEKTDRYLHTAIKNRIQSSDLEVGSFLSGGIDSGLVTAIASEYTNKLKTFTVSFDGEYDEAPLAKLVAEKYDTTHTEIKISFDHLTYDIERILSNYGEPFFDSSAIPSYYVSAAAKKHLTVILTGDGADELFGGYRRYVPFAKHDFFTMNAVVKNIAALVKKALPVPHNKKSKYNYLYRLASLASKDNLAVYLSAGVDILEEYENNMIHPPATYLQPMQDDFDTIAGTHISGLKKIMNMDFNTTLFSDLLVKMDIANMANSIEGRSPFLCKELLEYAPGMNDHFKIKGSTTKYLLRQLSKKYLPQELINQPKRGFEVPLKNWVENELKDIINDYVSSDSSLCQQFVEKSFIIALLNNKVNISAEKRAKILWSWLSLEIWYKKVYLQ
ncbi:MAG TPA: asparagine synthase (glutamine-hydrolyzing) [Ferruginibacter sp.]|jgi:asparagine synthase (glutamine-hydrolysing)|nr:asparagine synthase (glutamine-hydrolyzing) [Ferruginibacter sp.]